MPFIIWPLVAIGGIVATGWSADQVGNAADSSAKLTKWVVIGGGLYVGYRALQSSGALK